MVAVVQLVRASDCGSECRGFESHLPPIRSSSSELLFLFPPISQARSRAHPAHCQHHPAHSRAHPTHCRAHPTHSRAHPVYIQAPTPSHHHRPRKTQKPPTPPGAHPSEAGGYLGKAGGYLDAVGGYLHAAADHLGRRVSDETSIRTVRYVHPRRPIRASNDGHHAAEPAHNQYLADR